MICYIEKSVLKMGGRIQIKVMLPSHTASSKIDYSSSNKKVAAISTRGNIKALRKGTTVITVKTFNGNK